MSNPAPVFSQEILREAYRYGLVNVELGRAFEQSRGYAKPGMRALMMTVMDDGDQQGFTRLNFAGFEGFNQQFEVAEFCDKNGIACLTAREAGRYNFTEDVSYPIAKVGEYFSFAEPDKLDLLIEYSQTAKEAPYVEWLENLVRSQRAAQPK